MDDSFDNWLKERTPETDADDGRLSPGTVIGAYRVETFLGKGGFAEVYRAVSTTGERVAIKILHRLDDQSRMRFERESNILSQIHHPNIPKLLAFGSCGDRPYLVTELLQTKDLPHTDAAVARFIKAVCVAADALHKMGYVHRDIKPSNVLWRGDTPVLIDFGLVCLKSETPRSPSTISIVDGQRIVVGTAGYAAPEQLAGGKIDETTDVHAIGMLADACFNGEPPKWWCKIIDCATNSRSNVRYFSAVAFAAAVEFRLLNTRDIKLARQDFSAPTKYDARSYCDLQRSLKEDVNLMIVKVLGVSAEKITFNSRLIDDLGADYIDCFELMMALDEYYGVRTPAGRLRDIVWVSDVYEYYYDVLNRLMLISMHAEGGRQLPKVMRLKRWLSRFLTIPGDCPTERGEK